MADLTAADLPRIHFRTTDSTGKPVRVSLADADNRQFALWLRSHAVGRNASVFWHFPVGERVVWANRVNSERPVELTPVPGIEDDSL
jgi:hypothetical protein